MLIKLPLCKIHCGNAVDLDPSCIESIFDQSTEIGGPWCQIRTKSGEVWHVAMTRPELSNVLPMPPDGYFDATKPPHSRPAT